LVQGEQGQLLLGQEVLAVLHLLLYQRHGMAKLFGPLMVVAVALRVLVVAAAEVAKPEQGKEVPVLIFRELQ
jgi:F420-0:gamma-glutamyl ligase